MAYFATDYTIHFDDTMAYGSHHFLTAFKFQCAARESFLFGDRIIDVPGVQGALDDIHLFTADAYARRRNQRFNQVEVRMRLAYAEPGSVAAMLSQGDFAYSRHSAPSCGATRCRTRCWAPRP